MADENLLNLDALAPTESRANVVNGATADPDAVAKARRLAPQIGSIPQNVVADPQAAEAALRRQQGSAAVEGNGYIADYAKDPQAAQVSSDDWPMMQKLSTAMTLLKQIVNPAADPRVRDALLRPTIAGAHTPEELDKAFGAGAIKEGMQAGVLSGELGELGFQKSLGNNINEDRLAFIQKHLKEVDEKGTIGTEIGKVIGSFIPSLTETGVGMGTGGAILGPAGAGGGALVGLAESQGRIAYGQNYVDLIGKGVDPQTARVASLAYGITVGATAAIGGQYAGTMYKGAMNSVVEAGFKLLRTDPLFWRPFYAASKEIGHSAMTNGALMALQETAKVITDDIAKSISLNDAETVLNSPTRRDEAARQLATAWVSGMKLGAGIAVLPAGVNMIADRIHMENAWRNVQTADALMKARDESKTFERAPDLIQKFAEDHGLGDVAYINPMVLQELRKKDGELFGFMPDIDARIAKANAAGMDLEFPIAEFLRHVRTDQYAILKDDLRWDKTGLTANEATHLRDNPPNYITAFHGTPFDFDQFKISSIGTGEGAQAYGYGLYFTSDKGIAEGYRDNLTRRHTEEGRQGLLLDGEDYTRMLGTDEKSQLVRAELDTAMSDGLFEKDVKANNKTLDELIQNSKEREREARAAGDDQILRHEKMIQEGLAELKDRLEIKGPELYPTVYTVSLKMKPETLLHWDEPIAKQTPEVQKMLEALWKKMYPNTWEESFQGLRGQDIINDLETRLGPEGARQALLDMGITGVKFRSGGHRRVNANGKIETLTINGEKYNARNPEHWLAKEIHDAGSADDLLETYNRFGEQARRDSAGHQFEIDAIRNYTDQELDWYANQSGQQIPMKNNVTDFAALRKNLLNWQEDWKAQKLSDAERWERDAANLKDKIDRNDLPKTEVTEIEPEHNYVVFDENHIEVTHKNDVEVGLKVPPEVLADPHAAAVFDAVHDSMVEQTAQNMKAAAIDGLFAEASDAGMSKAMFALYSRRLKEVQQAIQDKAFATAEKEAKRRLTKEWKETYSEFRDQVVEEFNQRPDFRLLRYLREGEGAMTEGLPRMRLDKKVTEAYLGDFAGNRSDYPSIDQLPKGIWEKKGLHPDQMASLFGYENGADMLRALRAIEEEKDLRGTTYKGLADAKVAEEALARTEEKLGKIDERVRKEAEEAALQTEQMDLLAAELDFLAEKGGLEKPLTKAELVETARGLWAEQKAVDNKTKAWIQRAGQHGRDAEMFLLKKDYAAAFRSKQSQMIHLEMARLSTEFDKTLGQLQKRIDRFADNPTLGSVSQPYTDQIQKLLSQLGFVIDRADLNVPENLASFVQRMENEGRDIMVPDSILYGDPMYHVQGKDKPFKDFTVGEVEDLHVALKSLEHNGKLEKKLETAIGEMEFTDAVETAVRTLGASGEVFDPKSISGARGQLRAMDAALVRAERLLDWLDRGNENGIFNTVLNRPMQESKHAQHDFRTRIGQMLTDLRKQIDPKAFKASFLDQQLSNTTLMDRKADGTQSDKPYNFTRRELRSAMLYMGSKTGLDKMLRGMEWDEAAFRDFVNQNATKEDIAAVNMLHKVMDELRPDVFRVVENRFGVAPPKVEAVPTDLQNGRLTGGYWPIIGDRERGGQTGSRRGLFDDDAYLNLGKPSFAKERTGAVFPVDLTSYDMFGHRLDQTIHFITFTETLENANRFVQDNRVYQAISEKFGKEYADSLREWIRDNARSKMMTDAEIGWLHRVARKLRTNAIYADIGLNIGTIMKHGFTLFSHSLAEVKPGNFMRALDQFVSDPWAVREKLMAESGELRTATEAIDRDLRAQANKLVGENGWQQALLAWTTKGVALSDAMSRYPVYMAAKAEGLAKGMTEAEAIYHAEKTVRNSHGAVTNVDLPKLFRSQSEFVKMWTVFGNVWNHMYNQLRDTGRDIYSSGDLTNLKYDKRMDKFWGVTQRSIFLAALPAIVDGYLVAGAPKEKESSAWWFAKAMGLQIGGTIPFVSSIVRGIEFAGTGRKEQTIGTPASLEIMNEVIRNVSNASRAAKDEKVPSTWLLDALALPGYALGIPYVQPAKTARYLWEENSKYIPEQDPAEFVRGLMWGPKPKRSH